jgi:hypothetical protein
MQFCIAHYLKHLHLFHGCCILAKAKKLHCVLSSSNFQSYKWFPTDPICHLTKSRAQKAIELLFSRIKTANTEQASGWKSDSICMHISLAGSSIAPGARSLILIPRAGGKKLIIFRSNYISHLRRCAPAWNVYRCYHVSARALKRRNGKTGCVRPRRARAEDGGQVHFIIKNVTSESQGTTLAHKRESGQCVLDVIL